MSQDPMFWMLLFGAIVGILLRACMSYYRRRRAMTPVERMVEDRELDEHMQGW